jgi:hypothetical protein
MARACRAPRAVAVKGHWRQVRKKRKRPRRAPAANWVVTRGGRVVTRHRTFTAAVKSRQRLDRASYRRGQGRPYNVDKAA